MYYPSIFHPYEKRWISCHTSPLSAGCVVFKTDNNRCNIQALSRGWWLFLLVSWTTLRSLDDGCMWDRIYQRLNLHPVIWGYSRWIIRTIGLCLMIYVLQPFQAVSSTLFFTVCRRLEPLYPFTGCYAGLHTRKGFSICNSAAYSIRFLLVISSSSIGCQSSGHLRLARLSAVVGCLLFKLSLIMDGQP